MCFTTLKTRMMISVSLSAVTTCNGDNRGTDGHVRVNIWRWTLSMYLAYIVCKTNDLFNYFVWAILIWEFIWTNSTKMTEQCTLFHKSAVQTVRSKNRVGWPHSIEAWANLTLNPNLTPNNCEMASPTHCRSDCKGRHTVANVTYLLPLADTRQVQL